ncbi:MAG: TPM domain-containing protein [Nitrospira sp.]
MNCINMSRVRRRPARLVVFLATLFMALPGLAVDVPPLTARVVDPSHVLPAATAESLTADLAAHETKTGNQVAVLILPSLGGEPLEPFSHRVATTWKLGHKGTDNGVLLLVVLKERKVRIEVGYGLEGSLTDARSAQIIRNEIVPRFRAGDLPAGVVAGADAILKTIEGTYQAPERPAAPVIGDDGTGQILAALVIGVLFGLVLSNVNRLVGALAGAGLSLWLAPWLVPAVITAVATLLLLLLVGSARAGRQGRMSRGFEDGTWYSSRDGGWGGGFDGGGFSGGGGDFGGGGASGDW